MDATSDTGVVLLGHGSRRDHANDGLYEVAQALRDGGQYRVVEVGFMQRNFPTIEEAAKACVLLGAKTVLLIPYFLHAGLHLHRDLPETVPLLQAMHPGVRFALGKPFAHHPKVLDIVQDRIDECIAAAADTGADGAEPTAEKQLRPNRALRSGYTTGACAAAAAKAAAQVLLGGKRVIQIEIALPTGQQVTFPVGRCQIEPDWTRCSVIKDAGDDPDVTNSAELCASVAWANVPGVAIEGGEGVGIITKPGLELPVGSAAINPVPRKMIEQGVREALGSALAERGVRVTISVPAGEALAKKTLNARLGIVGGISILGTTGIVVPFSTAAYTASVAQALGVAVAMGCRVVVLTTGRRTERFAQAAVALAEEAFVQVGDYMGFALEECISRGVERVTVGLMVGKLAKLAAGHMQTHVSQSTVDQSFLAQVAA
ncbi:MAG: cobalt-precorrin-5B (C(1))-methyltransferase, partial [Chloroflexota bacterium]